MSDYTQAQACAALAGWSFKRLGEREIEIQCPTFSTPVVVSLDVADRRLRAFYSLAADLVEAAEQPPLLRMLATRARSFPGYPLGYHIPEVFAALGEEPPQPDQSPAASMTYGQARQLVQEMVDAQPSPAEGDATRRGLLPCPFCGRRPVLTVRPDNAEATSYFAAVACFCGGYAACAHKDATASEADEAERLAREKWNGRAAHPQPKGTMPGREWLEGMVDAWLASAEESTPLVADAFRTCAADLERALRLNPREAVQSPAPAPGLTDMQIDKLLHALDDLALNFGDDLPGLALNSRGLERSREAVRKALADAGAPAASPAVKAEPMAVEQIDRGAQKLAALFDYPWEHMPEQGRRTMRENVVKVFEAALSKPPVQGSQS